MADGSGFASGCVTTPSSPARPRTGPARCRTGGAGRLVRHASLAAATLLLLPATAVAAPAPLVQTGKPNAIDGQYIVVLKPAAGADATDRARRTVRARGGRIRHVYSRALRGFSAKLSDRALIDVRRDPAVAYVEPDAVISIAATQSEATFGLDRIDQPDLPLTTTYSYQQTGAGVTAYIIDTGIRTTHAQFGGRAESGFDSIDGALPADDCNGHGTHVAGTVGSESFGVAKDVRLVAVRVLDCGGSGSYSGVIAGVDYVTGSHAAGAPAVANMSLGGPVSTALDDAVEASIADGVSYALAAGNDAVDACGSSPARVPDALTVGATDSADSEASFSNYGSCLALLAPGVSIASTWSTSDSATNTISGTSMATPHVAGVAALYLEQAPADSPASVHAAVVSGSTADILDLYDGLGTPNLLLYSLIAPVDTTAPQTTIDSGPTGTITTAEARFDFSAEAAATFECRMDAGGWTACSSPKLYSALPDGAHVFSVRATDPAGNTDPTAPTRSFRVDTRVPSGGGGPASANPGAATGAPADSLDASAGPNPISGAAALKLTISLKRGTLAAILARGLRVTSTCSARCRVKVQVRLDRKTARKLKLKGLVGQRIGTAASSAPNRLTVRFNAKVRKALGRLHRITFTVLLTARDARGHATTPVKRTLTLKR